MITIYHNPRCSKSREACQLVEQTHNATNEPVEIVEYLKHPLTTAQLKKLVRMLNGSPRDLLRATEAEYKTLNLGYPDITDDQLYQAIEAHPILLQRPIVVRDGRAVIGRPPENIKILFD